MSASIDNDPADEGGDARSVLAAWLDDYSAGRCDPDEMHASFLSVCRSNPDAPWDALALLDQYQRRGRIDTELVRSLKADIAQLVFGVPSQTELPKELPKDDTQAHLDTTGSRWRKLLADGDPETIDAEPAFVDPTLFRRDFDPATRPPAPLKLREDGGSARASSDVLRDRYELRSILGRGSTGSVYKALDRHRAHLPESARHVAVKVLKLNYSDRPEALAELEREFHQAQSLSHPNIVSTFDLDRDGGTYFIVMQLLEGELLADILRRLDGRPMLREHALGIISSIGAALAHAHRREIVHADLKPHNIMITSAGEVRVLDFGFARNRALELHSASVLRDYVMPAPAYASVERVNGSEPDASDDIYSLACIAYELLSGQHPFGGRSAVLARAHGRRPRRIRGLTRKQSQALNRALLWTRGERKIDVVELLAALGCADAPTRLVPPDLLAIPAARISWRGRVLGMAAFLMLVVAGAAFVYFQPIWSPFIEIAGPVTAPAPPRQQPDTAPAESTGVHSAIEAPAPPSQAVTKETAPERAEDERPRQAAEASTPLPPPAVDARQSAPAGPVTIEFEKDTYVATESDGSVRVLVTRAGSTREPVRFRWLLRGNSAEQGSDFAGIGPDVEQIPAGASQAGITIPLVSDALVENTEVFLVEIEPQQDGVRLGERSHAVVILVDDD